jgi:cytochrome c peroxidase
MMAPAVTVGGIVSLVLQQQQQQDQLAMMEASSANKVDMTKVRNKIVDIMEESQEDDGSSMLGTFVRLSWHSCGTFQKSDNSGGSNGACMRHNPEASYGNNAGLDLARAALEPVKEAFPGLPYADLYTFAGKVAIEEAGGPVIPYAVGRVDKENGHASDPKDRLPDADKGYIPRTIKHIRTIFYRMGFNDQGTRVMVLH